VQVAHPLRQESAPRACVPTSVRFIELTRQQPSVTKIVARFSVQLILNWGGLVLHSFVNACSLGSDGSVIKWEILRDRLNRWRSTNP
jgi:hypothetical protein